MLLTSFAGNPQGVATGAGPDGNIWFTMSSNEIGMINPSNPRAGVTQYSIPTANSAAGPIAAGPQSILYASDSSDPLIYKIDKTTGRVVQSIPVAKPQDSLIFDSHNDIIYSDCCVGGVGEVRRVDPTVGVSSDTLLATVGYFAGDLALTPDGNSVLVTARASGTEYVISLTHPGQQPTTFGSNQFYGGIVYDKSGRLFAATNSAVVELDPNTFKVIASSGPLSGLDGLSFDPFSGDLFASTHFVSPVSGRQGIYELSLQPGNFLHATLISSNTFPTTFDPDGIEPDGEGNVYVASFLGAIYQYNISTGKWTALTSTLRGLDDLVPLQGTGGHSVPDYWFFEEASEKFGMLNPTNGRITELPLLTSGSPQVDGIAAGPGGTIWFTEYNTDRIGMIDTDTDKITEFPVPTANALPYGIVEGPDGNMWFTEAGADKVGRINTATNLIQEFPIDSSGNDAAEGIAVGPDSNLWFTLPGANKIGVMNPKTAAMIGEYSVSTANAGLSQIVSDPADGNLWFVEPAAGKVGRINPTSKFVAEFAAPTAGAAPEAITVDKGGNIWFIESKVSKIGEFSPNNPNQITEYGVPGLTALAPSVVDEKPQFTQKINKKGKKVGKPVLTGFELDFNTAMNPITAGNTLNYTVTFAATTHGKKKRGPVYQPVRVHATYYPSKNAVVLKLVGKQTFAKGGQITINAASPNGVASATGDLLAANDTVFNILAKASGVWPSGRVL